MKTTTSSPTLSGVAATLAIPLWARATESRRPNPIIHDETAVALLRAMNMDTSAFENARLSQVGVAVRTELLDKAVGAFCERHHDAVVVNLGAGLDTRYTRIKPQVARWYDLDLPAVIDLRRGFFPETEHYRLIASSVLEPSWVDAVDAEGRPVLLIAEGLFMYFSEDELKPLLGALATQFAEAELLFEMLGPLMVGKARMHDSVRKADRAVEFRWGLADSRELETWHPFIRFIEEWNYFDFHKDRWGWFGAIARLPFIRPRVASRIVHLRFRRHEREEHKA